MIIVDTAVIYYITDPLFIPKVDADWGHTYAASDLPAVSVELRGTNKEGDPWIANIWSLAGGTEVYFEGITEAEVEGLQDYLIRGNPQFDEGYHKAIGHDGQKWCVPAAPQGENAKGYEVTCNWKRPGHISDYARSRMVSGLDVEPLTPITDRGM